jgi:predicted transposase YbfD/YdcC
MVAAKRTNEVTNKEQVENRYYIVSDPSMTAERLMELTRRHWSEENELHWVLDVGFKEDRSRIRSCHAAENFGAMRRIPVHSVDGGRPVCGSRVDDARLSTFPARTNKP